MRAWSFCEAGKGYHSLLLNAQRRTTAYQNGLQGEASDHCLDDRPGYTLWP